MSFPRLSTTSIAASVALATAAVAQGVVVLPDQFTDTEAPWYSQSALGAYSPQHRFLQIYDDLQGTPRTINAVSFRRDGQNETSTLNGGTMLVNVFVSTAATTAATPDTTFDNNHGADRTQVARNLIVRLPQSAPGGGPRGWDYRVPFQTPFQFGGAGPLCVEIQVTSNTSSSGVQIDAVLNRSTNPPPLTWSIGSGCIATTTQTRAMSINLSTSTTWSSGRSRLNINGNYLPPNDLVFLVFGVQDQALGGIPLPFTLPGTASAPSGACSVHHDIVIDVPQLTDTNGRLNAQVDIPIQAGANGFNLFASTIALDVGANAFGIVTSNATRVQFIEPYGLPPVGFVYNTNGLGATGTARANGGLITRIE